MFTGGSSCPFGHLCIFSILDFLSELGLEKGGLYSLHLILLFIAIPVLIIYRNNPEDVCLPKIVENKYDI